jgi:transcriptional regulator with XRE-family HTH domain
MAEKELPEDIGTFIRDLRQTAKISLRQLADKAGVSNPYLSQIERGLRKPSAEVLQQIASALRVSTPAMYLRAGLLDSEGQPGVLAAIAVDPDLTIAQKQSLSQIYETFRNENRRHGADADTAAADAGVPAPPPDVSEEDALLARIAQDEADRQGDTVRRDTVLRDVAVVESGAAPAPQTTTTTEENK